MGEVKERRGTHEDLVFLPFWGEDDIGGGGLGLGW